MEPSKAQAAVSTAQHHLLVLLLTRDKSAFHFKSFHLLICVHKRAGGEGECVGAVSSEEWRFLRTEAEEHPCVDSALHTESDTMVVGEPG